MAQVTVIIPVYNGEKTIEEAVRSVLAQTYRDLHLRVYDDGSKDGTLEVLKKLQAENQDSRLEVRTAPNAGAIAVRNRALQEASSEWIAFLDADDVAQPNRIEKQLEIVRADPQVAAVGSWIEFIDESGRSLGYRRYPTDDSEIRAALPLRNPMAHPSILFKRSAVLEAGGYEAGTLGAEDYRLWIRLAKRWKLANVPEYLVRYRIHSEQSKAKFTKEQLRQTLLAQSLARSLGYPAGLRYWLNRAAHLPLFVLPSPWVVRLFMLKTTGKRA